MSAKLRLAPRWLGGLAVLLCLVAQEAAVRAQDVGPEQSRRADELFLVDNTFEGPTGGIRVIDAASGPTGSFRLAFNNELMWKSDFISSGDEVRHYAGNFSLSIAPIEHLELFASFEVSSDKNALEETLLIQRVADVLLGAKGFHWFRPWLAVGGDASLDFVGGAGDARASFRSTSVGIRGSVTLDFRAFEQRILPLIARLNAQYWFDNSANLAEAIEQGRLEDLAEVLPAPLEARHLLTPFERFAYGINRVDTVRLAIGAEAPLRAGRTGLHPLLEWRWDLPVNRQGFQCVYMQDSPAAEHCLAQQKAKAFPMTLTAGLRVLPPVRGLSVRLGVDVGVTGSRVFVRELAPTAPYSIVLGVSYAFDPGHARRVAEREPTASDRPLELSAAPVDSVLGESEPDGETGMTRSEAASGRLELTVIGTAGRHLSGVRIELTGPVDREARSNEKGRVIFESLPAGAYRVWIRDRAYLTAATELAVGLDATHRGSLRAWRRPKQPGVRVSSGQIRLRSSIRFSMGSAEVSPKSELLLAELADFLLNQPALVRLRIEGHTDNVGEPRRNLQISRQRAEAVRARLLRHGVDPSRLTARGYGAAHPILPNITAQNRARNRRVQIMVERRVAIGAAGKP